MFPFEAGMLWIVALISWILPLAVALWLILSINEIKSILREIRDELRATTSHDARSA